VLRLRNEAVIEIEEELPLNEADRKANVIRQAWVYLGCKKRYRSIRVRVVWVRTPKEVLLLVSNQSPQQLGGDLVAEHYWRDACAPRSGRLQRSDHFFTSSKGKIAVFLIFLGRFAVYPLSP